jgi:hypothetical protein
MLNIDIAGVTKSYAGIVRCYSLLGFTESDGEEDALLRFLSGAGCFRWIQSVSELSASVAATLKASPYSWSSILGVRVLCRHRDSMVFVYEKVCRRAGTIDVYIDEVGPTGLRRQDVVEVRQAGGRESVAAKVGGIVVCTLRDRGALAHRSGRFGGNVSVSLGSWAEERVTA